MGVGRGMRRVQLWKVMGPSWEKLLPSTGYENMEGYILVCEGGGAYGLCWSAPTGGGAPGWWYDEGSATLHVRTAPLSTGAGHVIDQRGGEVRDRS